MSIDEPDINFGLVRLGQTVSKEMTVNNMSQIITTSKTVQNLLPLRMIW